MGRARRRGSFVCPHHRRACPASPGERPSGPARCAIVCARSVPAVAFATAVKRETGSGAPPACAVPATVRRRRIAQAGRAGRLKPLPIAAGRRRHDRRPARIPADADGEPGSPDMAPAWDGRHAKSASRHEASSTPWFAVFLPACLHVCSLVHHSSAQHDLHRSGSHRRAAHRRRGRLPRRQVARGDRGRHRRRARAPARPRAGRYRPRRDARRQGRRTRPGGLLRAPWLAAGGDRARSHRPRCAAGDGTAPSSAAFARFGVEGVCEPCALAAAPHGRLLVPKTIVDGVTVAIAGPA